MQSTAKPITTQRRLILVRHAHAVTEDEGGDHARALSAQGVAQAAALGDWLRAQSWLPEAALCSTAARTRQTLGILAESLRAAGACPFLPTQLSDRLYLASVGDLLAQIQAADDAVETLLVVCHNPGAHGLLGLLVDEAATDADAEQLLLQFPPSACALLTLPATHWRDVAPQSARLEVLRAG